MRLDASVIIATYNRQDLLAVTLRSLSMQSGALFEVLVVDQTSASLSRELQESLASDFLRFRYYHVQPPNLPAARNFGVQHASAEVLIFIDDDVILMPDFVKEHLGAYTQDKGLAGLAGRVVLPGVRRDRTLFHVSDHGTDLGGFDVASSARDVHSARGCNMSFQRAALLQIGGFDTGYLDGAHREETDVCVRLRRFGYRIDYTPKAALVHLVAPTGGARATNARALESAVFYRNEFRFARMLGHGRIGVAYTLNLLYRRVLREGGIRSASSGRRILAMLQGARAERKVRPSPVRSAEVLE